MRVPVYDIKNCGPRHRFVANGKLVHNSDSVNMQNLPRSSPLKKAMQAPPGYVVIDCDSSQIEARTLAFVAGQWDLVDTFRKNNEEMAAGVPKSEWQHDPYKLMASELYGVPLSQVTGDQRQVGKVVLLGCFGPDTRVLTLRGWLPIVDVKATDKVWDGEEWVTHEGVVPQGEKEVLTAYGVSATPDHAILTEHGWQEWQEVLTDHSLFLSALGRAHSLSFVGSRTAKNTNPWSGATVAGKVVSTDGTSKPNGLHGATHALKRRLIRTVRSIWGTLTSYPTTPTENVYSTAYQLVSPGATLPARRSPTKTMGVGVLRYTSRGAKTDALFWPTWHPYPDGTFQKTNWTAPITTGGTSPETFALSPAVKTCVTGGPYRPFKQKLMTYDIAYAGPRNRYTIATDAGPIIVHNCGYGLGWKKFMVYAKQQNIEVDEDFAKRTISVYRERFPYIPAIWKAGDEALDCIVSGYATTLGVGLKLDIDGAIVLPNKFRIPYPNLRYTEKDNGKLALVYDTKKGRAVVPKGIWGGAVTENWSQALARLTIGEQMLMIARRYKVAMTVHDSVVVVAPQEEANEARAFVEQCMRIRPKWAAALPLNCESKIGPSYGG